MINFYPASILRERGPGPFLDNDVARYIAVWTKLHDIIFKCQGPGWGAVGNGGYIGVFVWTKDSEMDLRTPSGMTSSS
ncbi:MAG: hypothetical protein L6R39_007858 [Caloplaca ligustica]|nr:MAG: hypothetical protein L6R39_007858 [Caloplaca ligustica]